MCNCFEKHHPALHNHKLKSDAIDWKNCLNWYKIYWIFVITNEILAKDIVYTLGTKQLQQICSTIIDDTLQDPVQVPTCYIIKTIAFHKILLSFLQVNIKLNFKWNFIHVCCSLHRNFIVFTMTSLLDNNNIFVE